MSKPKHYKVITVERGTDSEGRPGYAARCETEGCGAITFDRYPSRSAARASLAGHEDAPGSGGNQPEGENQNTNTHEGEPIVMQSIEATHAHLEAAS